MDNDPGISLFENPTYRDLNHLEPEELEALEDEKRRNEELKEIMLTAFDDLEEDSHSIENSYCDSSTSYESNVQKHSKGSKHLSNETPVNIPNSSPRFRSPGYDNYQQLQVLYQVRLREIDQLRSNFENFKESSSKEKSYLSERIDVLEAEKQKALISFDESQKTLIESKTRLSTIENDLREWKSRFSETENQKNKAIHELEMCKLANREMEQRLVVAEKNVFRNDEKNFDIFLKEVNSKHKREISDFQKEITSLNNKLMAKENECLKLSATNHDTTKLLSQLKSQKAEINSLSVQITALKKERNQLNESLQKYKSEKTANYNSIQNESREEIQELEKKLQEISIENKNLKEAISSNELKNKNEKNVLKIIEDNITADFREKVSKLESDLEESIKECDNVKKLYNEVCFTKDSLLKKNISIEREVADLKKEKNKMNELIKNLTNEKDEMTEKLKTLQGQLDNQKKDLENLAICHQDELRKSSEKHIHEIDALKLSLKNEFSKVEVFHQDQLSKLELEYAKKILEMESSHKTQLLQTESNVKEEAVRICSEEIQMLSDSYKKQYDELILHALDLEQRLKEKTANYDSLKKQMDELKLSQEGEERSELKKLRIDLKNIETKYNSALTEWNEKLEQSNEKSEKLRLECQEVYNKYKKARKAAKTLKETLDERNQFFRERQAQYVQTMNDILHRLNDVLNFKSAETKTILDELINGDVLSPSEEFNSVMCDINQKLLLLKNKS